MLSIRFDGEREWWVSGRVFERLYLAALDSGSMPARLEHWRHVADANGGLTVSDLPRSEADELTAALRVTAERELEGLAEDGADPFDTTYRVSLAKLLKVLS